MSVTGYLALYTTLLGWQQYQNLWQIALGTGLIYLPFVSIVLTSTIGPFTSMGAKDAAQIATRRLVLNMLSAFFVIAVACAPTMPLDPKVLHFSPLCQSNTQPATPGNTGTTYDNALPVPTGVNIPILWYLVMAFSNGITHAASASLPCMPFDYRELHSQLNLSTIQDPQLKDEVSRFYQECYVPAYSTYLSGQMTSEQQQAVQQSLAQNGKDDIGWLGSQTFLNVPGFYDSHNAQSPVAGFPFDPDRDIEEGQVQNHSQWGNPDCKTWWSDLQQGLHTQLGNSLPQSVTSAILQMGNNTQQLQDAAIKTLITQSYHASALDKWRGYESLDDQASGDYLSRFVGAPLGIGLESLSFYPKLHLLINALPVIQALMLMAIYMFLALAIPFSSYRTHFIITGMFIIFAITFFSFLWACTHWVDQVLMQSLYPPAGIFEVNGQGTYNQIFTDMLIGTMYVALPLLFLMVMSWAGMQAGNALSGIFGSMTSVADRAGNQAGALARSAISKITKI